MSKRILPFSEKPKLRSYQHDAFTLGILQPFEGFSYDWILNRFLFLEVRNEMIFYRMPSVIYFWDCFKSHLILIFKKSNFIDTIKKYIATNNYIYIVVNERFIPERFAYGTFDFNHNILIYGFDDSKQSFLTIGYNKYGRYEPQWVCYDDMKQAYFNHLKLSKVFWKKQLCVIFALRINEKRMYSGLNLKKISNSLQKYITTTSKNKGINIYNYIKTHIRLMQPMNNLDMRYFRVVLEHAWILNELIKKLNFGSLLDESSQLYKKLNIIFYLAFKYNVTKDTALLEDIVEKIDGIIFEEKNTIEKLLQKIKHSGFHC